MNTALRFFPLQWRDHLLTRGAAMVIVGIVLLLPFIGTAHATHAAVDELGPLFTSYLRGTAPLLVLVAVYGVIGQDVRQGYYRFLFAKPISPIGYYALAFVAAGLTYVAVELALNGIFALVVAPTLPVGALLDALVEFVLLGGVVFALSRVSRLDWLIAILTFALGDFARRRFPPHDSALGAVLNVVFPPSHAGTLFPAGAHPEWGHLAWALGYGLAMVVIGLAAVRYTQMGSSR